MSHVKFGCTWYLLSLLVCCGTFVPQQCTNPQGTSGTVSHPMPCSFCLTSLTCKPSFVFSSNLFSLTELFSEVSQCEISIPLLRQCLQLTGAGGCVGIRVKSTPIYVTYLIISEWAHTFCLDSETETGRWVRKLIRFLCRVMIRYQVQTLCGSKHQSLLPTTGTRTTDSEERRAVDCVCAHFHAHLDARNHAVPNKTAEVVKIALPTVKRSAQPINWHCV